jgi:hypothetical protein
MIVPDYIANSLLSCGEKNKRRMLSHQTTITWSNVSRVQKTVIPTSRQTPKNVAKTHSNRQQLPSCGNSKTAPPHKERLPKNGGGNDKT